MFSKKEILVSVLAVAFFGLLILELPKLEKILSNRKEFEYNEETSAKKQVDKFICTFSSKSNVLTTIIEANFYINEDKVTRIYTKTSRSYAKKIDFEGATIKEDVKTDTLEIKTTKDELNYTIIETKGENITESTKTTYPTKYDELTKYLETNNYTCTIRYKK